MDECKDCCKDSCKLEESSVSGWVLNLRFRLAGLRSGGLSLKAFGFGVQTLGRLELEQLRHGIVKPSALKAEPCSGRTS